MKKFTLSVLIVLMSLSATTLNAQTEPKFELSPMVGYQLSGNIQYYQGEFRIQDAMNYGAYFNVLVARQQRLELGYSIMSTTAEFIPYASYIGDYNRWTGDANIHYINIGGVGEIPTESAVTLFGGISLGATIFDIKEPGITDVWRMNLAVKGGLKIAVSDKVGIRLQGRLLMPMFFAGAGFYAGIGTGGASTGISMNAGVIVLQGDFQGGLVFGF